MTNEKRNVLRCCLNIASNGADITCGRRLFQKMAPKTGKARLPKVERLNSGTASWLVEVDRSLCRDGTSATRVKYDDRYVGALLFTARYSRYGDLEKYALPDTKPVEADERVSDVLGAQYPEYEPCCVVLYRLKTANQVGRQTSQHTVAVVKSAEN